MTNNFLESAKKQFEYYKMLGEKTFVQLTDEQLFKQLNEEGKTIILITHEDEIARYAKRIIRIVDGKIVNDERK